MDIDYKAINEDPRFDRLSSRQVMDNAMGCASSTENKTSIYLLDAEDNCVARLCNISLSNIDGHPSLDPIPDNIDDFGVWWRNVCDLVCLNAGGAYQLRMNKYAYAQLVSDWYGEKGVKRPERFDKFNGTMIVVDPSVSCTQKTVI
ncbi:hypothetical protein LCGC14_1592790 [marine sediment metagenome]|uniref:Uncharacterized protein n=1 Tax=marine sediment metagenome TaxID=412755 RepID=A0A0F9IDG0_9ZZZZ